MIVADWLWPSAARRKAEEHNAACHSGVPTAYIVTVRQGYHEDYIGPSRYRVVCRECGKKTDGDSADTQAAPRTAPDG